MDKKPSSESATVVKKSSGATIVRKADRTASTGQQDRRPNLDLIRAMEIEVKVVEVNKTRQ